MMDCIHMVSMFCSSCGKQFEVSADVDFVFCPYCGAKNKTIQKESSATPVDSNVPPPKPSKKNSGTEKKLPPKSKSKKFNKRIIPFIGIAAILLTLLISVGVYNANRYDWSTVVLGEIIPKPELPKGEIIVNSASGFTMHLFNSSVESFNEYVADCTAAGFSHDAETDLGFYRAFNEDGYELELWYFASESEIHLSLFKPVKYDEFQWPDNIYSGLIPIPKSTTGRLVETEKYLELYLGETTKDEYGKYIDACVEHGFTYNQERSDKTFTAKNNNGYILNADYVPYNTVRIKIRDPEYPVSLQISCVKNWFLDKYDISVYVDDSFVTYIPHGDHEQIDLELKNGSHVLRIEGDADDEPSGEIEFTVNGETKLSFKASCHGSYISIKDLASTEPDGELADTPQEDSEAPDESNSIEATPVEIIPTFSKENAKRAAVVAMTNGHATDVLTSDGNHYDPSKFHSYSDLSSFYMTVYEEGTWTGKDETTWHVEGLTLNIAGYDSYVKASLDVTFDGNNYIVSNATCVTAKLKYLDSDDPSKIGVEVMEPSDYNSFLTVSPELIEADRDESAPTEVPDKEDDARTNWIDQQFSIWDGSHKELKKLIIKNLNDEDSFKHIETEYIDVCDETWKDSVNSILKEAGHSQRVEIGDLFIITEFSAKNAFGGTIKCIAYGISSYTHGTITLVGIE